MGYIGNWTPQYESQKLERFSNEFGMTAWQSSLNALKPLCLNHLYVNHFVSYSASTEMHYVSELGHVNQAEETLECLL